MDVTYESLEKEADKFEKESNNFQSKIKPSDLMTDYEIGYEEMRNKALEVIKRCINEEIKTLDEYCTATGEKYYHGYRQACKVLLERLKKEKDLNVSIVTP